MKMRPRVLEDVAGGAFLLFLKSSNATCHHQQPHCQAFTMANRPWFGRWKRCRMSFIFSSYCPLPLASHPFCLPWYWCKKNRGSELWGEGKGDKIRFLAAGSPVIRGKSWSAQPCQGGGLSSWWAISRVLSERWACPRQSVTWLTLKALYLKLKVIYNKFHCFILFRILHLHCNWPRNFPFFDTTFS